MISFRYHIVSIVAVFLALALGIVIGTTALSGPITRDLRKQVNDAKNQRDDLSVQVKTLQGQVNDAGEFATTYGAKLVGGALTGKKIVEVILPGVSADMQTGVERELAAAGAAVSGKVTITSTYLDPSQGSGIVSLATSANRPAPTLTLPETNDPGQLGGALLSYALLGKATQSDVTSVLGSFSELHMLNLDGQTLVPSADVVVLTSGAPSGSYASSSELSLVSAMIDPKNGGKVVVAGDPGSAGAKGLVGMVRAATTTRDAVSTVDNADGAFGQVSAALALAGTIKAQVGQYGTQNGAQALFPDPSS